MKDALPCWHKSESVILTYLCKYSFWQLSILSFPHTLDHQEPQVPFQSRGPMSHFRLFLENNSFPAQIISEILTLCSNHSCATCVSRGMFRTKPNVTVTHGEGFCFHPQAAVLNESVLPPDLIGSKELVSPACWLSSALIFSSCHHPASFILCDGQSEYLAVLTYSFPSKGCRLQDLQ